MRATGPFEVTVTKTRLPGTRRDSVPSALRLSKVFRGDLQGRGRGVMLSAFGTVPNSAGYVAIERFDGSLGGRSGSFLLQHMGRLDRGRPSLVIRIVPDSGTEELRGISGSMSIQIRRDRHSYLLRYELPKARRTPVRPAGKPRGRRWAAARPLSRR